MEPHAVFLSKPLHSQWAFGHMQTCHLHDTRTFKYQADGDRRNKKVFYRKYSSRGEQYNVYVIVAYIDTY